MHLRDAPSPSGPQVVAMPYVNHEMDKAVLAWGMEEARPQRGDLLRVERGLQRSQKAFDYLCMGWV